MSVTKGTLVSEIAEGRKVEGVFLVKELNRGETKAGKPFLRLTLMDNSGEISGPVWDDAEALAPLCQPGSFLAVSGQGESYRGTPQLKIARVAAVAADSVALADFMPSGDFDREQLLTELAELIAGVQNPQLKKLLENIFQEGELAVSFKNAPAAKTMHHAYLGGLLEHTVAVAKLAAAVAALYPALDRDLLLAGALLHDLGKTEELTFQGYPFDYSNRGRLVGHLVIGAELVGQQAAQIPDFPPELSERLQHLILSHHGRHEFGAPTLPMMQEAFILHFLDDLDAKVNYFARLGKRSSESDYHWSEYQRNLERYLYLPGHAATDTEPPAPDQQLGPEPESKPAPKPAPPAPKPEPPEQLASPDREEQPAPGNPEQHSRRRPATPESEPEPPVRQKGLWG